MSDVTEHEMTKRQDEAPAGSAGEGLSRRDFLKVGGAGLTAASLLGVAGCGGEGEQGGGQQGGGGDGNSLVVAIETEPNILNPFITGGDLAVTSEVTAGILEAPFVTLPDFSYAPQLAEELPEVISEDPLTVEYRLKEGITFSDGEPLTSDDALFTYETIMNEDNQIVTRTGWEDIESFETPDERTVRITFSEPYAPWRDLLTGRSSSILPRHVYEDANFNEDLNNEIVGSGPFVLREFNRGQNLILDRNDDYWGEAAGLESINFRFISDTNTQINAFEAQEVDFVPITPDIGVPERLEQLETSVNANVQSKAGTVWAHITFNVEEIDDVRMRQAIAYGINRQQIADELLQGQIVKLDSVLVPEQEPYYSPAWERYGFDPDQARQLIEEASAEGAATEITYKASADSQLLETLLQLIQQQLEDVGLTIELDFADSSTFLSQDLPESNFEMATFAWSASPDPSYTTLFSAEQLPPDGQNVGRYVNEEVTDLLQQADRAIDVDERAEFTRQWQELMAEDVPILPLYQRPEIYVSVENLSGPEVNPTLAGPFWNIGEWTLG